MGVRRGLGYWEKKRFRDKFSDEVGGRMGEVRPDSPGSTRIPAFVKSSHRLTIIYSNGLGPEVLQSVELSVF